MDDEIFGSNNSGSDMKNEPNNEEKDDNSFSSETENVSADAVNVSGNNEEPYTTHDNNSYQPADEGRYSNNPYYNQNGYNPGSAYNYNQNQYNNNPYGQNAPYGQYGNSYQNQGQHNYSPYDNGEQPPKKSNKGMKVFIGVIAAIVVLCIALMVAVFSDSSYNDNDIENQTSAEDGNTTDSSNVGDIVLSASSLEAGEAAVVAEIAQRFNVGILVYMDNSLYTEGSGVIVKEDDDGKFTYIVTCAHVVNYDKAALSVLMSDGTEYPADLVGLDTRTDIAVVRIEASGLPKAELADSDALIVGQTIYAVGNPGGSEFFGSVTNGIISAIDRPVSSSTGYEMECIQHTAAINPGNSGGALVNGEGKLVGINSMKIASTEYEGMGFAVPSSVVMEVFNSIIENGYVAGRAKLGISYTTPSGYSQTYAMYVQMKGLPSGTIVIAEIAEDSDLAGKDVKVGDMITQVNGKDMTDSGMLSEMIEDMSAGDTLTLTIVRVNTNDWSQTEQKITVTLVEDRGNTTVSSSEQQPDDYSDYYGYGSEDWYEYFKQYFGNGY